MGKRLIERDHKPAPGDVAARYPGVFAGEWFYGGQKHGWTLRFKKWVLIEADSDEAVSDIETLLQVKRRPSG